MKLLVVVLVVLLLRSVALGVVDVDKSVDRDVQLNRL